MQFVVPSDEFEAVEMEAFTHAEMDIQGVKPAGWTEAGPGVYVRGNSGLDVVTVIEQGAPMSAASLLTRLTGQLGLEAAPASVGEREANALIWTLYAVTVQGVQVDFAIAESDGKALIVLLQSMPAERDALYQSVFLPALDALTLSD